MKKILLAGLCCLLAFPVLAEEDLPMFDSDEPVENVSGGQKGTIPNVGSHAKTVDSVSFSPGLPKVGVSMGDGEENDRPFGESKMRYGRSSDVKRTTSTASSGTYSSVPSSSSSVSSPVDYSAQVGKPIEIVQKEEEPEKVKPPKKEPKKKEEAKSKNTPKKQAQNAKKPGQAKQEVKVADPNKVMFFNIADIYLGMQPEDVIETAAESGFELTNVAYGIPSFMISDYERICRESGLYQTRLIHECMRETARDNEVYYISQLVFERTDSREKITVLFSSSLTDNQAFKIDYTALGDNSLGTSYKDLLKKTHRRDIFWKYVYDKYGKPEGSNVFFWGNPKKVYLRAFLSGNSMDGRIVLEDVTQMGVDYTQAQADDKERDINNPFHF